MSNQDGGSAFPCPTHDGMSLRDYFAAQAMAGILAGRLADDIDDTTDQPTLLADLAFIIADAMILRRSKL